MREHQYLVNGMTVDDLLAFHRRRFGDARMESEGEESGDSSTAAASDEVSDGSDGNGKTFTQADLDEVTAKVRREERRKASERFADYDDLKTKAGEKQTVEERLAAMEKRATDAEVGRLRSDIAAEHGISKEDRDLFLTGADEDTLTAQAKRLAARESERKKQGNYVPNIGKNPKPSENDERAAVRGLFGSHD